MWIPATCYDRYGWVASALVVYFVLVTGTGTLASDRRMPQKYSSKTILKLYFVRHGETLANTIRRVVGQSDSVRS